MVLLPNKLAVSKFYQLQRLIMMKTLMVKIKLNVHKHKFHLLGSIKRYEAPDFCRKKVQSSNSTKKLKGLEKQTVLIVGNC